MYLLLRLSVLFVTFTRVIIRIRVHGYGFHLCLANRGTRSRQSSPPGTVGGYERLGYGTKILSTHTLTVSSYGERRLSYVLDWWGWRGGGNVEARAVERGQVD